MQAKVYKSSIVLSRLLDSLKYIQSIVKKKLIAFCGKMNNNQVNHDIRKFCTVGEFPVFYQAVRAAQFYFRPVEHLQTTFRPEFHNSLEHIYHSLLYRLYL